MTFAGENIWIIGASSGIGRELAVQLANLGSTLILSARRGGEIENLKKVLGSQHKTLPLDISDARQVQEACKKVVAMQGTLDRVVVVSALYEPCSILNMDIDFASKVIDVNIKGVFYVIQSMLPIFTRQKKGQIALCGSVAGYTGLPNGQPYSATKAAIINFTESLYAELPNYIDVKLINPGFVNTPMTAKNTFPMPMIVSPQKAAQRILNGLCSKAFEIHFPKTFTFGMKVLSILPYTIKLFLTKKMRQKTKLEKLPPDKI